MKNKRKKLTIYLAGYSKESEYRRIVKEKYGQFFTLIDPMDFEIEQVVKSMAVEDACHLVIRRDKEMIIGSDILVAYINRPSFGTIMEIMFAYMNNIPVYIINENGQWINDLWLYYHATELFNSIESCFTYLISCPV